MNCDYNNTLLKSDDANDARLETTLTSLTDSEVLVPHGVESDDALAHLALQVVEPQVRQELNVRVHRQVRCQILDDQKGFLVILHGDTCKR